MANENYLLISDLQTPYEHSKALQFCKDIKKHYKISDNNVYCLGDETDQLHGSRFPKGADYPHTPNEEIQRAKESLKEWAYFFPRMKLVTSNHGDRWKKKMFEAEIPSQMMRAYEDLMEFPDTWLFKDSWLVQAKSPFIIEHGHNWGGRTPHVQAAIYNGVSTAMGHHHSIAGVEFLHLPQGKKIWGACGGSLIDREAYAFKYSKGSKHQPCVGTLVVLNDGTLPIWIPIY